MTIIRPLRRDGKGDFVSATGVEALRATVAQVLGTQAQSAVTSGEFPPRTDLGSRLHLLRHRSRTPALDELAREYVRDALGRWLPGVELREVKVRGDAEERAIEIDVELDGLAGAAASARVMVRP